MADDRRSRSPYGERGLKLGYLHPKALGEGRSPYGERGLKFDGRRQGIGFPHVALLTESVD